MLIFQSPCSCAHIKTDKEIRELEAARNKNIGNDCMNLKMASLN
jgi:hypothetical protein